MIYSEHEHISRDLTLSHEITKNNIPFQHKMISVLNSGRKWMISIFNCFKLQVLISFGVICVIFLFYDMPDVFRGRQVWHPDGPVLHLDPFPNKVMRQWYVQTVACLCLAVKISWAKCSKTWMNFLADALFTALILINVPRYHLKNTLPTPRVC